MKQIILLSLLSITFSQTSCNKNGTHHECYDKSIVHDNPCTHDCPGFEGCDGNLYCNECEAAREGIGPK